MIGACMSRSAVTVLLYYIFRIFSSLCQAHVDYTTSIMLLLTNVLRHECFCTLDQVGLVQWRWEGWCQATPVKSSDLKDQNPFSSRRVKPVLVENGKAWSCVRFIYCICFYSSQDLHVSPRNKLSYVRCIIDTKARLKMCSWCTCVIHYLGWNFLTITERGKKYLSESLISFEAWGNPFFQRRMVYLVDISAKSARVPTLLTEESSWKIWKCKGCNRFIMPFSDIISTYAHWLSWTDLPSTANRSRYQA